MAAESTEQLFRQLLTQSKDSYDADYAAGEAISHGDLLLENLVRTKLTANAHSANLRESVLASVRAGGGYASAESEEQTLLKTGVTGWS